MNLKISTTAISLLILVVSTFSSQPEPRPLSAKQKDIKQLLEETGTREMAMQMMTHMISSYRESRSDIPDAVWTMFIAEMDPDELISLCIPAYDNHFSHEEIKQLLEFYQSPTGKLLLERQPLVMQECLIAGEQFGQQLNDRVNANIKEFYGQNDSANKQEIPTHAESKTGTQYHDQLFTMIAQTNDEKKYLAYEAGKIDPKGKMCGLIFGMSMDEVIAIWGKPSDFTIKTIGHQPEQVLYYDATRLNFSNNKLYEVSFHNINFQNVEICEGITFDMNQEQVAAACSKLSSTAQGGRIYYDVADGVTMKPHFYKGGSDPEPRLISVEISNYNLKGQDSLLELANMIIKENSNPKNINSIIGAHNVIAFDYHLKDAPDSKIKAKALKDSKLLITKDHIAVTNFQGKELMYIGDSPILDTISEKDFIVGYFKGDENAAFYIQPEEYELNGTAHTATCFSCELSDGAYIILWIE